MARVIDVLLMFGLPASGKAEARCYLESLPAPQRREEFHLGPMVHIQDYSYVHMMRRISQEMRMLGRDSIFFASDDAPLRDWRDWGMLIEMLNEDFGDHVNRRQVEPPSAAAWLFDRYDAARARCGIPAALGKLPPDVREKLVFALEVEAQEMVALRNAAVSTPLDGCTMVISIARGGPDKAQPPLPPPLGYQYALTRFSDEILSRASILYVAVTPQQAQRNNAQRVRAGAVDTQSVIHHGVPQGVMLGDYGCDDMDYLLATSSRPDTVRVEARGGIFTVPVGRFDNRIDKTSFMHQDRATWTEKNVKALHRALRDAMARAVAAGAPLKERRAAAA